MSPRPTVDLRSDLLSRPSADAIDAMARAAAGSGAFGLREDTCQAELERRVASLLGMEDALLFPTCTMANETALLLLGRPGEVVITQEASHVVTSEGGAPAALAGLMPISLGGGATPALAAWVDAIESGDESKPRTGVVVVENTHNRSGGLPLPPDYTGAITDAARRAGVRSHLDGARLFNVAVALDVAPADVAAGFDTVAISLNKGLGAPLGAMLAGRRDTIRRALAIRHRLGGGIRPSGVVAAPALAMLERWPEVAEDHRRARRLAEYLGGIPGFAGERPATNIVLLRPGAGRSPASVCEALARAGVLALPFGADRVRFVTYRGLSDDDIDAAAEAIRAALGADTDVEAVAS